jgi:hypothetical protein
MASMEKRSLQMQNALTVTGIGDARHSHHRHEDDIRMKARGRGHLFQEFNWEIRVSW